MNMPGILPLQGRTSARPAIHSPQMVTIENRTARRIVIEATDPAAVGVAIGPFETLTMSRNERDQLKYAEWRRQNLISTSADDECAPENVRWEIGQWCADLTYVAFKSITFLLAFAIGFGLTAIPLLIWLGGYADRDIDQAATMQIFLQVLQWLFIGIASVLPAMMYFLFYRQKVHTLRETFLRDVVRLNPNIYTIDDAEALYGERVNDVYGATDSTRTLLNTHLPILVSTLLIALGWILVAHPAETLGANPSDLPLFRPEARAISFGFLGAYFFLLNMIFRRYVRSDLGPKAYNHIALRLLITVVLVWVVGRLPIFTTTPGQAESGLLVFAFLIGVVPETAMVAITDFLRGFEALKTRIPSLDEALPLTDLDGMTLYDRARLLEEGIENIENLAHHSIIDLMLWTRIPTPRLVDLLDQAVLYLHIVNPQLTIEAAGEGRMIDMATLRQYGIRTATDLIRVYELAQGLGEDTESLFALLDSSPLAQSPTPARRRLKTILDTLQDDDWVDWLRQWHRRSAIGQKLYYLKDFYGGLDRATPSPSVEQPSTRIGTPLDGQAPGGVVAGQTGLIAVPSI
jgi:hypothetical protein